MSDQIVIVEILEDPNPEPDEVFEIILASPKNGLLVGDPGKGKIAFFFDFFFLVLYLFLLTFSGFFTVEMAKCHPFEMFNGPNDRVYIESASSRCLNAAPPCK